MKVAIIGTSFRDIFFKEIKTFFQLLEAEGIEFYVYKKLYDFLVKEVKYKPNATKVFSVCDDYSQFDLAFSIGGDGSFLRAANMIADASIPIVGINSGHLGFLADISKDELEVTIKEIVAGQYKIEERTLLQFEDSTGKFTPYVYALNEIAVLRRDTSSMLTVHTYLNNEFLNSYRSDGLLISTPTGSTAYNMGAGGPIMVPQAQNFIITPVSPHSLTVRPIVVPDDVEITLKVESRAKNFLVSLDSKSKPFDIDTELVIRKAPFKVKVLQRLNHSFYKTLRNKLMWGVDKRDY